MADPVNPCEYIVKPDIYPVPDPGCGGIPDAPMDGKLYGRKDGTWVEVVGGSGGVNSVLIDGSTNYTSVDANGNVDLKIGDAIADGLSQAGHSSIGGEV